MVNGSTGGSFSNPYRLSPAPIHDVPTMNYYASEGTGGSGLGSLIDNQILMGADRDLMQASPRSSNYHQTPPPAHQNSQMATWFDSDL